MFPKSLTGVRGSWGWASVTGHCAVQAALVRLKSALGLQGGSSWALWGRRAGGNGDWTSWWSCPHTTICLGSSPQDGERRYREASARKKIRLDRQVEARRWEGTRLQFCLNSLSAPCPWELTCLWCCPWAGRLHPDSLWSWLHDTVVLPVPYTGEDAEDRGIWCPQAHR